MRRIREMARPVGTKVIPLTKFGFVRAPEEDFWDDGAKFTAYWWDPEGKGDKRFLLTKSLYDGDAFISVRYTLPGTRSDKYIDDLNGVPVADAIDGLPDLVEKIKEASEEVGSFKATVLTPEQIDQFASEVAEKADGKSSVDALARDILKSHGIEEDKLDSDSSNAYWKAWKKKVQEKTTTSLPKEVLQALAAKLLKETIQAYHRYWDLDRAVESAYAGVPYNGSTIYPSDLSDETVKRIKEWIKHRLTTADDFE